MKFTFFLIIYFPFIITSSFAQMQEVSINIVPANSYLKINNQVLSLNETNGVYSISLDEGIYPIELWSPKYELVRDTIIVKGDGAVRYRKILNKYDKTYVDYSRDLNKYKKHKFGYTTLDISLGLLNAGLITYVAIPVDVNKKLIEDINNASLNYKNAVTIEEVNNAKNRFEELNKRYQINVDIKRYVGVPLLTLSAGLSIYYYIKRKKIKQNLVKPKPYKSKNPFSETEIDLGLLNEGNGFFLGLKTNF